MKLEFGERLVQFANAIDIVDKETLNRVFDLVSTYVEKILDIKSISVFEEMQVNGLPYIYGILGNKSTYPIKDSSGNYSSQASITYENGTPLWIVSDKNNLELDATDVYIDQWSGMTQIPPYHTSACMDVRTSIILPIKKDSRICGVIVFESNRHIEITMEGKHELSMVSDALSKLLESLRIKQYMSMNTSHVLKGLELSLKNGRFHNLSQKYTENIISVKLHPMECPYSSINFEIILREQRKLHNIALLASNEISPYINNCTIDELINDDKGIPNHLRLRICSIEEGSIWMSLKSGSLKALEYVSSFYERGASARLSQETAEAGKASTEAEIAKQTSDAVAHHIITEKEMISAENLQKTYEVFRNECKAQLGFMDELIMQASAPELKAILMKKKDEAILSLSEQKMVPIVQNTQVELLNSQVSQGTIRESKC